MEENAGVAEEKPVAVVVEEEPVAVASEVGTKCECSASKDAERERAGENEPSFGFFCASSCGGREKAVVVEEKPVAVVVEEEPVAVVSEVGNCACSHVTSAVKWHHVRLQSV